MRYAVAYVVVASRSKKPNNYVISTIKTQTKTVLPILEKNKLIVGLLNALFHNLVTKRYMFRYPISIRESHMYSYPEGEHVSANPITWNYTRAYVSRADTSAQLMNIICTDAEPDCRATASVCLRS